MANDLQTLNERIAERVGKELVDLIPPDQWQKMVDSQINHFMSNTAPGIVKQLLTEKLKEAINASIISAGSEWDDTCSVMTNVLLKEVLQKSAAEIFASMLAPVMSGFLNDLQSRLRSGY